MLLKNRLTITTKDKTIVSYNNLLTPTIEFLSEFKPYAEFVAIGTGNKETTEDMERLESWAKTLPLVTDSFNFDPMNGELFLTQKLVLDEDNPTALEIVEIGLTADSVNPNPKIANRFLANAGASIFRDPYEEMTIEITVYLEQNNENTVKFTGGSNPLVKFLLGGGAETPVSFGLARGYDQSPNSEIVKRTIDSVEPVEGLVSVTTDLSTHSIEFKIETDLGFGVVDEILLIFGNSVVARENVKEVSGVVSGMTLTFTADADNMVTINENGLNSVTKVTNSSTGEEIAFSTRKFATSFQSVESEVLAGFGITASTPRVIERTGKKLGFIVGNSLKVFDFSGDEVVEHDTSVVNMTNAYLYAMYDKFIFLKIKNSFNSFDVRAYELVGNSYVSRDFNANCTNYNGVAKNQEWFAMDVGKAGEADNNQTMLFLTSGIWLFGYYLYQDAVTGSFESNKWTYTNYYYSNTVASMTKTNRHQMAYVSHDTKNDNCVIWLDKAFRPNKDSFAVDIVKNYKDNGYPKIAKNFIYAVDPSQNALKVFNVDDSVGKTLSFDGEITTSNAMEYIAVKTDGKYKLYYLDGDMTPYEFNDFLPCAEGESIVGLEFVGDFVLKFLEDGRIKKITFNKNKLIVESIEKGTTVDVSYVKDNTPGISGEPVKAVFKVNAKL